MIIPGDNWYADFDNGESYPLVCWKESNIDFNTTITTVFGCIVVGREVLSVHTAEKKLEIKFLGYFSEVGEHNSHEND